VSYWGENRYAVIREPDGRYSVIDKQDGNRPAIPGTFRRERAWREKSALERDNVKRKEAV